MSIEPFAEIFIFYGLVVKEYRELVEQYVFAQADGAELVYERGGADDDILKLLLPRDDPVLNLRRPVGELLLRGGHVRLVLPAVLEVDPQLVGQFHDLMGAVVRRSICDLEHIPALHVILLIKELDQ